MSKRPPPLEIWGGIECTRNRVNDRFFDQTVKSKHEQRRDDIALFAELGISALRYPFLWEKAAKGSNTFDWQWSDERTALLKAHHLDPIATFVHHGSGPLSTNLLADDFAEGLSIYAEAFARRYPWIQWYTPVNEPLTTARFSALYGYWYPHAKEPRAFLQALLNECRATVLSMEAIRKVQPEAVLIQTDDLGKTSSTPHLRYQADFENEGAIPVEVSPLSRRALNPFVHRPLHRIRLASAESIAGLQARPFLHELLRNG